MTSDGHERTNIPGACNELRLDRGDAVWLLGFKCGELVADVRVATAAMMVKDPDQVAGQSMFGVGVGVGVGWCEV
jgi:hypothetical protein